MKIFVSYRWIAEKSSGYSHGVVTGVKYPVLCKDIAEIIESNRPELDALVMLNYKVIPPRWIRWIIEIFCRN